MNSPAKEKHNSDHKSCLGLSEMGIILDRVQSHEKQVYTKMTKTQEGYFPREHASNSYH